MKKNLGKISQCHRGRILLLGLIMGLGMARGVWAIGLDNNAVGTRGMTLVSAFTAVADDASAVYYNPAGLALIPNEKLSLDAYLLMIHTDYSVQPAGGTKMSSTEPATIPGIFLSKTFADFGVGIGFFVPYGGASLHYADYPMPGYSLTTSLGVMAISPAVGVKLLPGLALGLSGAFYYATFNSKIDIQQTEMNLNGFTGFGADVGVLGQVTDTFKLGLSLKTPVALKIPGTTKTPLGTLDTAAEVTMPMYVVVGLADTLAEKLKVSLDVWYMLWGNTDKITITTNGIPTEQKTDYQNALQVNLGAEYLLLPGLTLRGGVRYGQAGTKDEGLGLTSIDLAGVSASLGLGVDVMESVALNLSGMCFFGGPKEVENVTYTDSLTALAIGVTAKF